MPIFLPNQGCPHRCIFCQQEKITAQKSLPIHGSHVREILDKAVASPTFHAGEEREVAFYGGTFTGLSLSAMEEILESVVPYVRKGHVHAIRVSTRPDALDIQRLVMMRYYGVATVELGAQSMDDEVLALSRRGHTARDTGVAVSLLKEYGFRAGIQLMPGLPGDSKESFMKTVDRVISLRPHMARLYPALVIRGTELATWYAEKRYRSLGLEEALDLCRDGCLRLEGSGIPVIRIGLLAQPSLLREGEIVAGPWHEAFGFLVRARIHLMKIQPYLPQLSPSSRIRIRAPQREIPLIRGHRNIGIRSIEALTGARVEDVVPDESVAAERIVVDIL